MADAFEGPKDGRQSDDVAHPVSRFRPTYRALPLDVVAELGGEIVGLAEQNTKSWLGGLISRARSLVKSEQEKLF